MTKYPMPFNNPYTYAGHGGIDYAQPAYTPIRAIADGRITFSARWTLRGGLTRTLTLDNGLQIMHCHLVNLAGPPIGSRVKAGDVIAYVGSTGFSTGNHLHQELWYRGVKQSGAKYWEWIDRNRVISAPKPPPKPSGGGSTPTPTPTGSEYPDMFIAIVRKSDWYLVVGGKACLLGAASGARTSGAPILNFPDEWSITQLKKIVSGIK